jgi:hypothetical protein
MNERDLRKLYESTGGDAADYDSWKRSNKNIIQKLSNQNDSGGSGSSGNSNNNLGKGFGETLMEGFGNILKGGLRQTSAPQGPDYLMDTVNAITTQKSGNIIEKIGTVLAELGTKAVADYAAEQSYLLTEVNEKLGLTGTLSEEFREEITRAQPALIRLGIPFDELVDSAKELVDTTGRFALVGADMLVRAGEIAQAYGMDMAEIVSSYSEFEKVGIGASQAQESIADAGERSLELGLQSKTTIKGISENIEKLNQYGFQNSVEGLEKMVRRATEVRMNLQDVFKVADQVFDPEGALELSANLQVLGAAFGDFNDPLRLMYMATNEVEGLQGALEGVSKNLATYNTETGAFEVTGANLRQARDIAKALNMDVKDLTQTAIAQQERMQASQMMSGLGLSEEQEEFLTNIARMKDGKMSIALTSPELQKQFGGATAISLDKIDQSVAKTLLKYQDEFKQMSEGEIVRRQATAVENINRDVNYLVTLARLRAAGVADNQIEKLVGIDAKDTGQNISDIIGMSTDKLVESFGLEGSAVIRKIQDKLGTTEQIKEQEERRKQVQGTTTQTTTKVIHEHNVKSDQVVGSFQKQWTLNPEQWIVDNSRSYTSNN